MTKALSGAFLFFQPYVYAKISKQFSKTKNHSDEIKNNFCEFFLQELLSVLKKIVFLQIK